jgi:hypothetical protein
MHRSYVKRLTCGICLHACIRQHFFNLFSTLHAWLRTSGKEMQNVFFRKPQLYLLARMSEHNWSNNVDYVDCNVYILRLATTALRMLHCLMVKINVGCMCHVILLFIYSTVFTDHHAGRQPRTLH